VEPQLRNRQPLRGIACSRTVASYGNTFVHLVGQEVPAGVLTIRPDPVTETVSRTGGGGGAFPKTAVTVWELANVTVHEGAFPVHAPCQPRKIESKPTSIESCMLGAAQESNVTMQSLGQRIALGTLVTTPVPP
jgi:hypothetical protein